MLHDRKQAILVLSGILIVAGAVGYATYRLAERNQVATDAESALFGNDELIRYVTTQGQDVSLDTYLGNVLYINSWASWSPLSESELITLNEVAGQYKDSGITFIALNRKETKEQAERYLTTLPPLPNLTIVIDTTDHFYAQVGGYAMPETLVFDDKGELRAHERTPQTREQMVALIETFIAKEE